VAVGARSRVATATNGLEAYDLACRVRPWHPSGSINCLAEALCSCHQGEILAALLGVLLQ
jgi:hypothetical protein